MSSPHRIITRTLYYQDAPGSVGRRWAVSCSCGWVAPAPVDSAAQADTDASAHVREQDARRAHSR